MCFLSSSHFAILFIYPVEFIHSLSHTSPCTCARVDQMEALYVNQIVNGIQRYEMSFFLFIFLLQMKRIWITCVVDIDWNSEYKSTLTRYPLNSPLGVEAVVGLLQLELTNELASPGCRSISVYLLSFCVELSLCVHNVQIRFCLLFHLFPILAR